MMARGARSLWWGALLLASVAQAQNFQVRSDELPTITGALNGSVLVQGGTGQALQVTVNFGDVSPLNRNAIVRVMIPVLLRSESSYQLTASVPTSTMGGDPDGVRLGDIGLGLINVRRFANGRVCPQPHQVVPPFQTDPAQTVIKTGRATYPATAATVQFPVVVMSGPRLSTRNVNPGGGAPFLSDGWAVDLILTIVPQFFVPGTSSLTLLLSLSSGPNLPCP